ncbi:DUF2799 domain-containing protein [Salinarimonas rosea]|uniref:DUF2799 domain-containing protein n=1 Tax=Salinarimonas rosea TaxID=552063 RepID=UPI00048B87CB|nr:DUF2799 domain-containing protein [Salinarimonas rosea]
MKSRTLALAVPALAVLAIGLSGCATITREECRAEDWSSIGQRDGAEGHAPSRLESHARVCANFDIVPDVAAYRSGWDSGVLLYCTPQNGFATGRDNDSYHGLCPASVAGPFLEGREIGARLGAAERRVASAESRLRNGDSERDRLRRRMDELRDDRTLSATDRRERIDEIRDRIDDLRWDMDRARFDLQQASAALPAAQAQAQRFFDRYARRQ